MTVYELMRLLTKYPPDAELAFKVSTERGIKTDDCYIVATWLIDNQVIVKMAEV